MKNNIMKNIMKLATNNVCFDLQFRKDTKYKRHNAPTYYRWKVQFVITDFKGKAKEMERIRKEIGCGRVHLTKDQARFSVQKIEDITNFIVPLFNRKKLSGSKKKDFELWKKSVDIIYRNKGKYLAKWKKKDLLSLIEIQKSIVKYKNRTRQPRWLSVAQSTVKSL